MRSRSTANGAKIVMNSTPDKRHPSSAALGAQMREHFPNPSWPNWGRDALDHGHAIFAIAAHLRTLELSACFGRLSYWLGRYDGFEQYVEEGCDPFFCVRDVLAACVVSSRSQSPDSREILYRKKRAALWERIVNAILSQEFLRYVAYWGRGLVHDTDARVWNPLRQPWMEFMESGEEGEELMVWRTHHLPIQRSLALHRAILLSA